MESDNMAEKTIKVENINGLLKMEKLIQKQLGLHWESSEGCILKPLTWSQEIDGLAADEATKDMIYALDKALEQGVIRILAREQFFH
ncbi:hypothetical protein WN943_016882 [Citrus x changshan-huyou]